MNAMSRFMKTEPLLNVNCFARIGSGIGILKCNTKRVSEYGPDVSSCENNNE
jgi:hypothetical protein